MNVLNAITQSSQNYRVEEIDKILAITAKQIKDVRFQCLEGLRYKITNDEGYIFLKPNEKIKIQSQRLKRFKIEIGTIQITDIEFNSGQEFEISSDFTIKNISEKETILSFTLKNLKDEYN